jgi:hypothetical protein
MTMAPEPRDRAPIYRLHGELELFGPWGRRDADAEASGSTTSVDRGVRDAIAEIDAWDEDGFRIVRAALGRLHPEQAKTVLAGLSLSTGAAAVLGVETLFDRLDASELFGANVCHRTPGTSPSS